MIGPLLRSGNLSAFHPLGSVGHPVYLAAAQLRAAIGRRLGAELADTFAIPQRNEDGDTVDWYAPRPGPVVPWSAASAQERTHAQGLLIQTRNQIQSLGQSMQADGDSERQVFGRLLTHVTTFPNEGHIYLVDGHPVITFWGFVQDQAAIGSDPLVNLDLLAASAAAPAPVVRRRLPWWLWALALLLLVGLLTLLALRGCEPPPLTLIPADQSGPPDGPLSPPQSPEDPRTRHLVNPDLADGPITEPLDSVSTTGAVRSYDQRVIDRDPGVSRVQAVDAGDLKDLSPDGIPVEPIPAGSSGELEGIPDGPPSDLGLGESASGPLEVPMDGSVDSPAEPPAGDGLDEPPVDDPVGDPVEVPMSGPGDGVSDVAAEGEAMDLPSSDPVPIESEGEDAPADPGTSTETGDPDSGQPAQPDESAATPVDSPTEDPSEQPAGAAPEDPALSSPADEASAQEGPGPTDSAPVADPQSVDPAGSGQPQPAGAGPTQSSTLSIPSKRLLSSGWRTATTLQDPKTGLPIQMEYQLKDGAGKVRLKRHDGSVCESGASAGLEGGKLVIDSSGNILCADGTNFGRPRVECEPGADGKARCRGSYPGGESFSIDMRQSDPSGSGE